MVTGAVSAAENIVKCVRRCGLEVEELVLQPIASATSVLHGDERDLGVVMVDIGGGTTDVAVYAGGAIRHTAVLPIAGDQITNDIAMALRTPTKDAEDLKQQHGYALRQLADSTVGIEVPGVGDRQPRQSSRQTLANVIEPRVEELFSLVQSELVRAGFGEGLSSGVVLTGGSAAMPGMAELGEEVFHMPVRIGQPNYDGVLAEFVRHPRYATAIGLVQSGYANHRQREIERIKEGPVRAFFRNARTWVQRNF
jgi:cell division protein FtsA